MDYVLTLTLSLVLLVAVVALLKERRLRLALQRLVSQLLNLWRKNDPDAKKRSSAADDDSADRDRL